MRRYALEHGLQMVHLEVLSYLHRCNRYSNTTQSLSEFLGQTKGSISQTVGFLETQGYLKRYQDDKDKRIYHLELLVKSKKLVEQFELSFYHEFEGLENISEKSLEGLLARIQKQHSLKSFGICSTCRFNNNPSGKKFVCGLTGENLSTEEIQTHCRDHELISL